MFSELRPGHAGPRPPGQRGGIDAQGRQVNCLLSAKQQQFGLAGMRRAGRLVLHQDVGRAAQVSMFDVKGDLVGRQGHLAAAFDHLELDHDKQAMRECQQAVRDAQVDPGLNPGEMGVWEVFFQAFVQVRLRFQGHRFPPLRVLARSAWASRPQSAPQCRRTGV